MIRLRDNEVILFQGDSITDGARGRSEDLNHIMGHGYQFIVAAKLYLDNADKNINIVNRGVSGNRISDIYARWDEDALDINPTVLSILAGVNDAHFAHLDGTGSSPSEYKEIYKKMLSLSKEKNPDLDIILMEPFTGKFEDEGKDKYFRDYVSALSDKVKELSAEFGAVFVPLQDAFDLYMKEIEPKRLIWDGVHPTVMGHEIIARRWLEVVEKELFNF